MFRHQRDHAGLARQLGESLEQHFEWDTKLVFGLAGGRGIGQLGLGIGAKSGDCLG
jgi:hypothetical protein